jgi:protein gp37
MDPAWVTEIRDKCLDARVPLFFKQWGGTRKKTAGRELEGRTWDEMPVAPQTWASRQPGWYALPALQNRVK